MDPIVQFPTNSQSLNPYTYILNNPFAGTDPTGYAIESNQLGSCSGGPLTIGCGRSPDMGPWMTRGFNGATAGAGPTGAEGLAEAEIQGGSNKGAETGVRAQFLRPAGAGRGSISRAGAAKRYSDPGFRTLVSAGSDRDAADDRPTSAGWTDRGQTGPLNRAHCGLHRARPRALVQRLQRPFRTHVCVRATLRQQVALGRHRIIASIAGGGSQSAFLERRLQHGTVVIQPMAGLR